MRVSPSDISRAFSIEADRIKSSLDEQEEFYWFYISLHLKPKGLSKVSISDIKFVEYHLRHSSFAEPNVRITNPNNGFEYKFWLYGFIAVDANVVLKSGEIGLLPIAKLKWDVTEDELRRNGRRELSW